VARPGRSGIHRRRAAEEVGSRVDDRRRPGERHAFPRDRGRDARHALDHERGRIQVAERGSRARLKVHDACTGRDVFSNKECVAVVGARAERGDDGARGTQRVVPELARRGGVAERVRALAEEADGAVAHVEPRT
jgi:hypothetical protein